MRIINKETGKEKVFATRQAILLNLLAPVKDDFSLESDTLAEIIDKYKDNPLIEYIPTQAQRTRMESDPEYAMDIPRYIVEGYDDAVSNSRFEQKLCDEFYNRFETQDRRLIRWINKKNPTYKIEY